VTRGKGICAYQISIAYPILNWQLMWRRWPIR